MTQPDPAGTAASASAGPLAGRHIGITRPLAQAADLADRLTALGARVTALSAIEIAPVEDPSALDAALRTLSAYDWLVFTSVNGVRAVDERLRTLGIGWRDRNSARIAAIGPATAAALARLGAAPDLVPDEYVAEAIAAGLGDVAGKRLLLARADIARKTLAEDLRAGGALVTEVAAYRTVETPLAPERLRAVLEADRVDALTFTSSSTVRGLLRSLADAGLNASDALRGVALVAIGPITARTLREHRLEPAAIASPYTIPGLVSAVVACLSAASVPRGE